MAATTQPDAVFNGSTVSALSNASGEVAKAGTYKYVAYAKRPLAANNLHGALRGNVDRPVARMEGPKLWPRDGRLCRRDPDRWCALAPKWVHGLAGGESTKRLPLSYLVHLDSSGHGTPVVSNLCTIEPARSSQEINFLERDAGTGPKVANGKSGLGLKARCT